MKRIYFLAFILLGILPLNAQNNQPGFIGTATLRTASRLFASTDDLTSVVLIIPADSVVSVIDSDSTYLHVVYQDSEGYIYKRQAVMDKIAVHSAQISQSQPAAQNSQSDQKQQQSRYSYLENKYGSNVANTLMAGKIWRGMDAEMVDDSWGTADKINRIISGNVVKEEWIYRNTWLYFENNTLLEWGPVKKQ